MKKIFTLVVLGAFGPVTSVAQDAPNVAVPEQTAAEPCLKIKKVSTETTAVAQGQRITIAVRLESTACDIAYQQERRSFAEGLSLDAQSPFRLRDGSTAYSKKSKRPAQDASAAFAGTARKLEYQLEVEAAPDAPLGKQNVDATLNYHVVNSNGVLETRAQVLSIPVIVVPAGTHVGRTAEAKLKSAGVITLEIAAGIALAPLFLAVNILIFLRTGEFWDGC